MKTMHGVPSVFIAPPFQFLGKPQRQPDRETPDCVSLPERCFQQTTTSCLCYPHLGYRSGDILYRRMASSGGHQSSFAVKKKKKKKRLLFCLLCVKQNGSVILSCSQCVSLRASSKMISLSCKRHLGRRPIARHTELLLLSFCGVKTCGCVLCQM